MKIWNIPCGSVKIENIISVERSYNPLSSPAASLHFYSCSCQKGNMACTGFGHIEKGINDVQLKHDSIETERQKAYIQHASNNAKCRKPLTLRR